MTAQTKLTWPCMILSLLLLSNVDITGAFTSFYSGARSVPSTISSSSSSSTSLFGILDDLKLIFSEEGKAARRAYAEKEKDEQEKALKEIQARRRNPKAMEEYNQETNERRQELMNERSKWDFQQKVEPGFDPKDEWDRLRAAGEIKVGSDLERGEIWEGERINNDKHKTTTHPVQIANKTVKRVAILSTTPHRRIFQPPWQRGLGRSEDRRAPALHRRRLRP